MANKQTQNLDPTTPSLDDVTVSFDYASPTELKKTTWQWVRDLFKTYFATLTGSETLENKTLTLPVFTNWAINFNAPEWFLINWKIVPSVTSGNITVAIKTLAGTDPSSTDPVYTRVNNAIRTITSACTITINNNDFYHFNSWSAELATKEVDYFVYLSTFWWPLISRVPSFWLVSEGTGWWEKAIANTGWFSAETINVVWRFTAIKASWATGNWSVPTFTSSNLIQRPIYETRWLDANSTVSATAPFTVSNIVINHFKYKIVWDNIFYKNSIKLDFWGTSANFFFETLPFWRNIIEGYDIAWNSFWYDNNDIAPSVIFESTDTSKLRIIKIPAVYALVTNATIKCMWNYKI